MNIKYFFTAAMVLSLAGAGCGGDQGDFAVQGNVDQAATTTEQPATTTQQAGNQQAVNQQPVIAPLTKDSCESAKGRWNPCASACEGKPAGELCIEACIQRCECGGPAGGQCPKDYACMTNQASSTPDTVGLCLAQLGARPVEPPEKYSDQKTSVVLPLGKTLSNPFIIQGTSTAAFENNMNWRLKTADGKIVASGQISVMSQEMGQPGPFEVVGWYDEIPNSESGTLEIYDTSAQDGKEIYNFPMQVNLTDLRTEVYAFFSNKTEDPDMKECSKVAASKRLSVGPLSLGLVVHELLRGTNAAEREQGFFTSIPDGVNHPAITGEQGVVKLDFNQSIQNGVAGSCKVTALRSQIEQTVRALLGNDVKIDIAVDGKTEGILQP